MLKPQSNKSRLPENLTPLECKKWQGYSKQKCLVYGRRDMAYMSFKPWVALQLLVAVKGFPSSFVQLKDSPVPGATIWHVFQASLPLMGRRQSTTKI